MVKWTAVVLTCQNKDSAQAFQYELELRQKKGYIDKNVLVLTVEDPKQCVGSGGATLNALLVTAEYLGARVGHTMVTAEVFQDKHILIVHMGRNFPFDPCGRAFVTVPMSSSSGTNAESLVCNIDLLLELMTSRIAANSPPGVWVCSGDTFLDIPCVIDGKEFEGETICVISVPGKLDYATNHGVYKINSKGIVDDIIFRGSKSTMESVSNDGETVCLVTAVAYLSVEISERLLSFHTMPPLDACTYMGLDSGAVPLELSLFFDILLTMCDEVSQDSYITGKRSGRYGTTKMMEGDLAVTMRNARALLWRELRGYKIKAVMVQDGYYSFMDDFPLTHHKHLLMNQRLNGPWTWQNNTYSIVKDGCPLGERAVVVNSMVDGSVPSNTVVVHSIIPSQLALGKECFVSGLQPEDLQDLSQASFNHNMVVQAFNIRLPSLKAAVCHKVITILGKFDDIRMPFSNRRSTYCNVPWILFLERTGITKEDLWPTDMNESEMNVMNAQLFPVANAHCNVGLAEILWLQGSESQLPVMLQSWRSSWRLSLSEILLCVDLSAEFKWRRDLFFQIGCKQVEKTLLLSQARGLPRLYWSACMEGYHQSMLQTLDKVVCECGKAGLAARTLANIADVLGCMADGQGGMRSGPAGNTRWAAAFDRLEKGDISGGVKSLGVERNKWLDRPDLLVRAARHYEGAAQILIRHAVMSARQYVKTSKGVVPPMGFWVVAESPARADLAGGWSDTPPITYEHGGAVTNIAIKLDGKKPIGAKARIIPKGIIKLNVGGDAAGSVLLITKLSDLDDYCKPHAAGALLKAAFICAEVVKYPSTTSLSDQLIQKYGGGFELHTWSNLPHGSGLGTSSILAGAVIAALWRASGQIYDTNALLHAVLHLEQLLTSGGGWQDQVGGLVGGVKIGHSAALLPLKVEVTPLNVSEETIKALDSQLILVYTGKTRLARNMVQNVLRNWYARNPEIVDTEDQLVNVAWQCARVLEQGDIAGLGACMSEYWQLKKKMAPGSEPTTVARMLSALRPYMHGATLAGAGGGGFLYVLMKDCKEQGDQDCFQKVKDVLATIEGGADVSVHRISIDMEGLMVTVQNPSENE